MDKTTKNLHDILKMCLLADQMHCIRYRYSNKQGLPHDGDSPFYLCSFYIGNLPHIHSFPEITIHCLDSCFLSVCQTIPLVVNGLYDLQ